MRYQKIEDNIICKTDNVLMLSIFALIKPLSMINPIGPSECCKELE